MLYGTVVVQLQLQKKQCLAGYIRKTKNIIVKEVEYDDELTLLQQ